MEQLSERGLAIEIARDEILRSLAERDGAHLLATPSELIRDLAGAGDRDAYRAAVTSLIASGHVEANSEWKLRLAPQSD